MQGIERTGVQMSEDRGFGAVESQMPSRRRQQNVPLPDFSAFLSLAHVQRTQLVQPLCIKLGVPDRHVHDDGDRQWEIRGKTGNEILERLWPSSRNSDQNNVQTKLRSRFKLGLRFTGCGYRFHGSETHI